MLTDESDLLNDPYAKQTLALKQLRKLGYISVQPDEQDNIHWYFYDKQFTTDGHNVRALYLQAQGFFGNVDNIDLMIDLNENDPDMWLLKPWRVRDLEGWVSDVKALFGGHLNIFDAAVKISKRAEVNG